MEGKLPIIYATDMIAPVAVRFRQQLNENAKMLCWHHVIPEMNHNELVGWRDKNDNLAVIYFRSKDDLSRNQVRIDINKEIIGNYTDTIIAPCLRRFDDPSASQSATLSTLTHCFGTREQLRSDQQWRVNSGRGR
jgi:hypothetical protein